LLQWVDLLAMQGQPLDLTTLRSMVYDLCQKIPDPSWYKRFVKHHSDKLTMAKASGLDPTRSKNFNRPTIHNYFKMLAVIHDKYGGIPAMQIWNMDEKGIQFGGGRKQGWRKFLFMKKCKHRYKLQSDNLELATVLECISAAGAVAPTSFVLAKGPYPDIRKVKNVGW
jgi:hypothetical protein